MFDIKTDPGRTVLVFPAITVTIEYELTGPYKLKKKGTSILIKDTTDIYNEESAFNQTKRGLRSMHLHIMNDWERQIPLTFNEAVRYFDLYKVRYHRYCAVD